MLEVLNKRYSVRDYTNEAISEAQLACILQAGQSAPTARNKQPWKVYVAQNDSSIQKLREITPCAYNAPMILILCGLDSESAINEHNEPYTLTDVSIVMTYMALEATNQGLGSCIVGSFDEDQVKKAFSIPEEERVHYLLLIGHPNGDSSASGNHLKRKPLSELVSRI